MASNVKEKVPLLEKGEIKCHELIKHFIKVLNLWFMYGTVDSEILKELLNSCVEIILHGLRTTRKQLQTRTKALVYDSSPTTSTASLKVNNNSKNDNSDLNLNQLHKIIDDFEWVRNAVIIRGISNTHPHRSVLSAGDRTSNTSPLQNYNLQNAIQKQILQPSLSSHVSKWLNHNLSEHNLCGFIQYLVNDKELLEEHYNQEALLRQKNYVKIIVIGLTAFETQQYGLISQIEEVLKGDIKELKPQERSNSQPNLLPFVRNKSNSNQPVLGTSTFQHYSGVSLTTIRRTQSLPELINKQINLNDVTDGFSLKRPRCKTIGTIKYMTTSPKNIPQKISKHSDYHVNPTDSNETASSAGSFLYDYDDNQPTTSKTSSNRSKSPLSNYTLNTNKSATSSLMSTSESSFNSNHTAKCIQLINTDDIKIWTDHSWEMKQKRKQLEPLEPAASCAVSTSMVATAKPSKSYGTLNSFFSSLFSTPPSYTSWFIDNGSLKEQDTTETAIESIIPDSKNPQNRNSVLFSQHQSDSLSHSTTVFDKFLPIDGKKVRSRKSLNIFDDVSTSLDYSGINMSTSTGNFSIELPSNALSPGSMPVPSKNCQSLTRYLQLSHLSRNNTDLEKENAHFLISEAIISAIEHIKWNKLETSRNNSCSEATPLATDYLASSDSLQKNTMPTTSNDIEGEHVPYAELEEVSYDLLSAEVVGLSLISKFDEKHLPKVSELKWLVADDDTPQKLLPMPDLSSTTSPDEHVINSATRGTRYWAPPRQQIIFTDHPSVNRKELLKKQNYRCAGCGMRVSPDYIQSFRYCTYLGKYHCTGCHRNQISAIPAKILQAYVAIQHVRRVCYEIGLQMWDFKYYPVSVFAYRLLEQMYAYPLFYVPDLNPALYVRCKSLLTARTKRLQLKYVKDFILMCRFALREQNYFESVPDYITADIDNWSMSDFMDTRAKCLHRSIDELIHKCENHIFGCVLCSARGFLCEYCHDDAVIYPWGSRVERCDDCGTCFHRNCWKSLCEKCCRCQRIGRRRDEINDVI